MTIREERQMLLAPKSEVLGMNGMNNICELLLKTVKPNKPKVMTGLD